MILEILEFVPFLVISMISAFYAYKLDVKYCYTCRINSKLGLKNSKSAIFYIGLMSLLMFLVPYIVVIKLGITKYIGYFIISVICGICCYSAMDYKNIVG